jgi:hypothetical protein
MYLKGRCNLSMLYMYAIGRDGSRTVVKPIPKVVEAILNQILCRSEVEPRVD